MPLPIGHTIHQPPHGYVRLIDVLGTDQRIVEAARVSYGSPSKGPEEDQKLLNYLFRMRHTSPFEQCSITFNIKFPIFLMRQFVRHRTARLNEVSARYTQLPDEFFLPRHWREQDKKNKQGSLASTAIDQDFCTMTCNKAYCMAYECYEELLAQGVAKEQARMVLPVGIYTEIYVNVDMHNLTHFLRLRLDGHAQEEVRDIAQAMYGIASSLFPWTMAAFERYRMRMIDIDSENGRGAMLLLD